MEVAVHFCANSRFFVVAALCPMATLTAASQPSSGSVSLVSTQEHAGCPKQPRSSNATIASLGRFTDTRTGAYLSNRSSARCGGRPDQVY
jgi:hypothetical protein